MKNNYFLITSYNNFLTTEVVETGISGINHLQHTFSILKILEQHSLRTYTNRGSNIIIDGATKHSYQLLPISNLNSPSSVTRGYSFDKSVIVTNEMGSDYIKKQHLTTCKGKWPVAVKRSGSAFALCWSGSAYSAGLTKFTDGQIDAPYLEQGGHLMATSAGICICLGNDDFINQNQIASAVVALIENGGYGQEVCSSMLEISKNKQQDNLDLTIIYMADNQIYGDTTLPVFNFNLYSDGNECEKKSLFPGGSISGDENIIDPLIVDEGVVPAFTTLALNQVKKPVFTKEHNRF